jgi:hypothetical protein
MEVAVKLGLPIIGVNLNGSRERDDRCPAAIQDQLAIYVPFGAKIVEHALENWPASHAKYKAERKTGAYHYKESVYANLDSNQ